MGTITSVNGFTHDMPIVCPPRLVSLQQSTRQMLIAPPTTTTSSNASLLLLFLSIPPVPTIHTGAAGGKKESKGHAKDGESCLSVVCVGSDMCLDLFLTPMQATWGRSSGPTTSLLCVGLNPMLPSVLKANTASGPRPWEEDEEEPDYLAPDETPEAEGACVSVYLFFLSLVRSISCALTCDTIASQHPTDDGGGASRRAPPGRTGSNGDFSSDDAQVHIKLK